MAPPASVHAETQIEASPARVFEAWVDPVDIARWYVDRAEGDAREVARVRWYLGGEPETLEVTTCDPDERLILTNVGEEPWLGTVLDVTLRARRGGTQLVVEQHTPSTALREHMPAVSSGWVCMLAVLKEYLERHDGSPRHQLEVRRDVVPNRLALATALRDAEAVSHWAEERPARVLASTPYGAVVSFTGHPGIFTFMGVGGLSVWYTAWGGEDAEAGIRKAQELADRLLERVQALSATSGR